MKILIDLGHPAHIHYFRNFISLMELKGHSFVFVARDKEVLFDLLESNNYEYVSRGKGKKTLIGKLLYLFYADLVIFRTAKKFKPDLFLSFASTYAAHISRFFRKPHIALDDTEHAKYELLMYPPFSDIILNPSVFWKKFSRKQLFFESYMELFYLHPKYFTPDSSIIESYGISDKEKFVILRFVSWNASHDIGQKGLSFDSKIKIVKTLEKYGKVFISAEGNLPQVLEPNRLKIKPAHLHHFLSFATLAVCEGSTTASECSVLGTPVIYVNSLTVSNCMEQEKKYGLCFHILDQEKIIEKAVELITKENLKNEHQKKRDIMLKNKIDGTGFLVWFVENYPASEGIMRINPAHQFKFL